MITVPEKLQLQISDALALIAASDFPEKWENLLPVSVDIRVEYMNTLTYFVLTTLLLLSKNRNLLAN